MRVDGVTEANILVALRHGQTITVDAGANAVVEITRFESGAVQLRKRLREAQGAALALEDKRIQGEAARCDEVMAWDDLRSKLRQVFAEVGAAPSLEARG